MEKLIDKFLRYVSVETTSDENSESQPSTAKQLNLLGMLRDELQAMGIEATLDEYGYVMATIPSNVDREIPAIGFIAQWMDLGMQMPREITTERILTMMENSVENLIARFRIER